MLPVLVPMAEASRIVLSGFELETEVKVVTWPDRYSDQRGVRMWAEVMSLINDAHVGSAFISHHPTRWGSIRK